MSRASLYGPTIRKPDRFLNGASNIKKLIPNYQKIDQYSIVCNRPNLTHPVAKWCFFSNDHLITRLIFKWSSLSHDKFPLKVGLQKIQNSNESFIWVFIILIITVCRSSLYQPDYRFVKLAHFILEKAWFWFKYVLKTSL